VPTDARALVQRAAHDLLRSLAALPEPPTLRVAEAEAGIACLVLVWNAAEVMPTAGAERRRRVGRGRAECQADILDALRTAGHPLTRKELLKALRSAGKNHGESTVAKALANMTTAGELLNPRDKRGYRLPDWPRKKRPKRTPTLF
jgi:hypothetical protein